MSEGRSAGDRLSLLTGFPHIGQDVLRKQLFGSRGFSLASLICVITAIILWVFFPELAWRPLFVALLPCGLRMEVGRIPFRRTSFDLPLFVFLLMAGVGVWTAYNREEAWARFWLLVASVLLYYAIASQPECNRWLLAGLFCLTGSGVSALYLITNDWQAQPAKIEALTRLGLAWMKLCPLARFQWIQHDVAACMSVIVIPVIVASGLYTLLEMRRLMLAGSIMTEEPVSTDRMDLR